MFGQNKVTGPYRPDPLEGQKPGDLKVTELFYTIQGEGPDAGRPAIFLRLTHCNLRCFFCDTQFDEGKWYPFDQLCRDILGLAQRHGCGLVVITGGEPLLQDFSDLVGVLNGHGIVVSVETAGIAYSHWLPLYFSPTRSIEGNLIVCSPKTPKINSQLEPLIGAYKYIVKAGETAVGLPMMSTQRQGERSAIFMSSDITVPIYIQAMDEGREIDNLRNLHEARDVCLKHGYRLSIQVHKLVGVP